jgi:hypothetical protein
MMKVSPLFLPLWTPEAKKDLENMLLSRSEISLNSTLLLDPESRQWSVSNDGSERGAFSIKLLDVLDASKATLSYGRLSGPEDLFEARNIVKMMQERITGQNTSGPKSNSNKLATDLMEFLPPEAVARLVLSKKGLAYVEMPFTTPFPVIRSNEIIEARMGIILDGESDSTYVTWRPIQHEGDEVRKVVWGENSLTKAEIEAIKGRNINEYTHFSLPSLANTQDSAGNNSESMSLLMAYAEPVPGHDRNIHSRGVTMNGLGMALRLAINSHKAFQAYQTNAVIQKHFGKEVMRDWNTSDQRLYQIPWENEEDMLEEIGMLPNVIKAIESGIKPFPALVNFVEDLDKERRSPHTTFSADTSLSEKVHAPEFNALVEAGMANLACSVYLHKRNERPNNPSLEL